MIFIKQDAKGFDNDIYALVKAFYPGEEIVLAKQPKISEEKLLFSLSFTYEPDKITMNFEDDKGVDVQEVAVDASRRKDAKNRLKRAVYHLLCRRCKKTLPWGTLTGIRPTKVPLGMLEAGKDKSEILFYMEETYECSPQKTALCVEVAQREHRILQPIDYEAGYSLYLGIPFCPSTCLYCSFPSYPAASYQDKMDDYLKALGKEIAFVGRHLSARPLQTVYVGGGTPTSLDARRLDTLFSMIERSLDCSHLLEFTVEAGRPDSITEEKLRTIHSHGVSRISINPQTMNQRTLDLIGRRHTVEQVKESFAMAREAGFSRINMDLILGLPGETLEDVAHTLREVQKLQPENLTVHSLALKRSARLNICWEQYRDMRMENSDVHMALAADAAADMKMAPYYLYRQKNMTGNLENIGFAREGTEGLYNVLIMEEKQTILALGAGAACKYVTDHGKTVMRSENVKDVNLYLERLDEMIDRKRQKLEEIGWL